MSQEQKQQYRDRKEYIKAKKEQVEELELNARYWKAQYEIKDFTIKDDTITPDYIAIVDRIQKANAAAAAEPVLENEENQEVENVG